VQVSVCVCLKVLFKGLCECVCESCVCLMHELGMPVNMCVCMYVCMVCLPHYTSRKPLHTHIFTSLSLSLSLSLSHTHTHTHVYIYIYLSLSHTHTHMHTYIYIFISPSHTHTHMHTYIYIFISPSLSHTHTHMHTGLPTAKKSPTSSISTTYLPSRSRRRTFNCPRRRIRFKTRWFNTRTRPTN
jgi:hypothetical protein